MSGITSEDLGPYFYKNALGGWVFDGGAVDADLKRPEVQRGYAALMAEAAAMAHAAAEGRDAEAKVKATVMTAAPASLAEGIEIAKREVDKLIVADDKAAAFKRKDLEMRCCRQLFADMCKSGFFGKDILGVACSSIHAFKVEITRCNPIDVKATLEKEVDKLTLVQENQERSILLKDTLRKAVSTYSDSDLEAYAESSFKLKITISSALYHCRTQTDTLVFLGAEHPCT